MSFADVDRHARASICDERMEGKERENPRVIQLTHKPRKKPTMSDTTMHSTEMAATILSENMLWLLELANVRGSFLS